ncbi:HvfC/BufC N-terminal domain-containing protein [Marinobacterium lutimaris]|uniref:Putative DNA-binding domain-containing protein n=1 Tax=Marinobacterium lutimaris TaxID=568106 RepID=A0A1H5VJY8_9GAMM|nr:DNA-binding domain-containing protein [Marinobacterium lutimaris]SEF87665.1 Putative DNA-binding domain-containing protein [Marinobacterium lutimaris]
MQSEQQRLLAAIFAGAESGSFDPRGLAVYQRNLKATARRALAISFPTVEKLIGDDLFGYATDQLLAVEPPSSGDWGVWGAGFGKLLDQLPELDDYPYVGDCARLDFNVHLSNRAIDSYVDVTSLQLLGTTPIDQLGLRLSPELVWLVSDYPIVDIWKAHHSGSKSVSREALEAAKDKLSQGVGQTALIYRVGHRALVRDLSLAERHWLKYLQQGLSLSNALELIGHTEFRFDEWLPDAVQQNLISGVEPL